MATGNFCFDNRCIVVLNEDFENGNIPSIGEYKSDSLRSYPSRYIETPKSFNFWDVIITSGYYEHSCIDYTRNDSDISEWIGNSYYLNTQSELIGEVKRFFNLSNYKIRKICGKVNECSDIDSYIERAYERLTEYLASEEEKEVNEFLNKLKKDYGYEEYCIAWRASNGETGYRKVG